MKRELPEKIDQIVTKAIEDISKEVEKEEDHREKRHLQHTVEREIRFRFRDMMHDQIRRPEHVND